MKSKLILTQLAIAALSLSFQESKAEGGCPSGFVPVGGGYCRNIVCPKIRMTPNDPPMTKTYDNSTRAPMEQYNLSCGFMGKWGAWGDTMIPMR